ncbi:MAG: hypothetical protein AAF623_11425, partial [Planctomycetota bacterium]
HLSVFLGRSGDQKRATEILNRIAPDDQKGYPPAHRVKAINLTDEYLKQNSDLNFQKVAFHLKNSDSTDPELNRAWAIYFEAKGEPKKAIDYLINASQTYPELYLTVAEIAQREGELTTRKEALNTCKFELTKRMVTEPLDVASRVNLARCHIELEDFRSAEKVLNDGMAIQPTQVLRRSLSNLYVMMLEEDGVTLSTKLILLKEAIEIDNESPVPFNKLVELTTLGQTEQEIQSAKQNFQSVIATFGSGALDHCNLAFIYFQEGDEEEKDWHLNQAWRIDPTFGKIAHRLARAFTLSETNPNSDWGLEIAKMAALKAPKEPIYRATLAEILLSRQEFKQAIAILNATLSDTQDQTSIHRRLAYAYNKIGESKRASLHSRKADESEVIAANQE